MGVIGGQPDVTDASLGTQAIREDLLTTAVGLGPDAAEETGCRVGND